MMKLTTLEERFLTSHFEHELLIGCFISDNEMADLFNALADIYLIDEKKREELRALCNEGQVRNIQSELDYNMYKRLAYFNRINGKSVDSGTEYIIDVKGRAINCLKESGYNPVLDATKPATVTFLTNTSQCGTVLSMRILGTLQLLGIFTPKNERAGLKLIRKASRWNDPDAMLTLLFHDKETRAQSISMLYSVSDGTPFEPLFEAARVRYGFENVEKHFETDLIEEAIGLGLAKAQVYSPQIARITYSEILDDVNKKKLVLNNPNLVGEINNLPIGLKKMKLEPSRASGNTVLEREEEMAGVLQSIMYASQASSALCPCIVANDDFVAGDYIRAIKNEFSEANIVEINASSLYSSDFSSDRNHVLVRSLAENKKNIVLIVMRGKPELQMVELLAKFMRADARREFRLAQPSISMDLSDVLPICICDSQVSKMVKHLCDCTEVNGIERDEAMKAIDRIIEQRAAEYALEDVELEDSARNALIDRLSSFQDTANLLDKLLYACKSKQSDGKITLARVEKLIESKIRRMGF